MSAPQVRSLESGIVTASHRGSWLPAALAVLIAVGLVVLSLAPGWVIHVRHQGGHGLTAITAVWNAWQGRAWPVLPLAMGLAVVAAALAAVELARPGRLPGRLPGWVRLAASLGCLALVAASAPTIERAGHASRVVVSAGWPLFAGIGLALAIVAAAVPAVRWDRRTLLVAGGASVLLLAAGVAGRVGALNLAEGDPRTYSVGIYVRPAASGQPAATLRLGDGRYELEGRWSGTLSGPGLVVVLTDDPACPEARGSYRIFPVGEDDIRWNLIVDLCADGERGRDLTTGVWELQE
jgi:hypothetical protein